MLTPIMAKVNKTIGETCSLLCAGWKTKDFKSYLYMSTRNKKLRPNADTKFLIWSLPANITCPFKSMLCGGCNGKDGFCYAQKAERCYPACLPSRMRNLDFSKSELFVPIMTAYIRKKATFRTWARAERIIVRIHESGDFYNQEYYDKWERIARNCADLENVVFMAYTKSIVYVRESRPSNLVIRFSVDESTPTDFIAMASDKGCNRYEVLDHVDWIAEDHVCKCDDCGTCNMCWDLAKAWIAVKKH